MWRWSRTRQLLLGCLALLITLALMQKFSVNKMTSNISYKPPYRNYQTTRKNWQFKGFTLEDISHLNGKLRQRKIDLQKIKSSTPVKFTSKTVSTESTKSMKFTTTTSKEISRKKILLNGAKSTPIRTTTVLRKYSTSQKSTPTSIPTTSKATKQKNTLTPQPKPLSSTKNNSISKLKFKPKILYTRPTLTSQDILNKNLQGIRKAEIKPEDKAIMLDLLKILWKAKNENNITIFLYGGTLLGSWRHHGFIAYDDDVDTVSPYDQYDKLYEALNKLKPDYYVAKAGKRLKFYSKNSNHSTAYWWRWPYVDIQFYERDANKLWDAAGEFKSYKYNVNDTFPLVMRPFEGDWYEAPRNTGNFLKSYYGDLSSCQTGWYSHKKEKGQGTIRVACEELKGMYPFVERRFTNNTIIEALKFKGKLLHEKKIFITR